MTKTLIDGRWVIGSDGDGHYLIENGAVVFEDDSILFVGRDYGDAVDERISAGNAVISPGFIDLDALFDLDSTVLGFDNSPGWKKGRVCAAAICFRSDDESLNGAWLQRLQRVSCFGVCFGIDLRPCFLLGVLYSKPCLSKLLPFTPESPWRSGALSGSEDL